MKRTRLFGMQYVSAFKLEEDGETLMQISVAVKYPAPSKRALTFSLGEAPMLLKELRAAVAVVEASLDAPDVVLEN